jgi:hypothetical protein
MKIIKMKKAKNTLMQGFLRQAAARGKIWQKLNNLIERR